MIHIYRGDGSLIHLPPGAERQALPEQALWIDLHDPTGDENDLVARLLDIDVPTREELKDIEPSSRLYREGNSVVMTASLVLRTGGRQATLTDVAFILSGPSLVTVRYGDPKSFHLFAASLQRGPQEVQSGVWLLAKLLETIIDNTAETLEHAVADIDSLSVEIFAQRARRRPPRYLEAKLAKIAEHHRLVAKVRDSLGSLSRVMTFVRTVTEIRDDELLDSLCATIERDVNTLSEHSAFVAGNIAFLLDASLGLINVEQNAIIKIFSIASVVFLPPTLVASIYGMNFKVMPELDWTYGYPLAISAMVMSALIPYFFFRWKGWL